MKKLILFLSLILSAGIVSAQSEIPSDSIRRAPSANVKEFGGFLLDMGIMNITTPQLPKTDLSIPNEYGCYLFSRIHRHLLSFIFRLRTRIQLGILLFTAVYADGIFQTEKRNANQYIRRL